MARLRGAIVGFGNVAANGHWPGFAASPEIEIVAIVDRSPSRRQAARAADVRVFESIEALAESGEAIDFVDIATPPSSHVPITRFALARGWHVACEKPLTLDPTVFASLSGEACAAGRVLFTMHNWKMAPILRAAFAAIDEGRIGAVRHVDVLVWRNQPCKGAADRAVAAGAAAADWRLDRDEAGGGILVDHGWHAFYLLLRLTNADPVSVAASVTRSGDRVEALDDSARVVVGFPASNAYLHLTWRANARRNAFLVYGDGGALVVDDDRLVVSERGRCPEIVTFPEALSAGSHHQEWFRALFCEFVREVRDHAARGGNLREAGWCSALTAAAYRSAAERGREVRVLAPRAGN